MESLNSSVQLVGHLIHGSVNDYEDVIQRCQCVTIDNDAHCRSVVEKAIPIVNQYLNAAGMTDAAQIRKYRDDVAAYLVSQCGVVHDDNLEATTVQYINRLISAELFGHVTATPQEVRTCMQAQAFTYCTIRSLGLRIRGWRPGLARR